MSSFRFPGVVWAALLVALPMLAMWLEQFFPGAIWAAPVAGLLLIAAKIVEVLQDAAHDPALGGMPEDMLYERAPAPREQRSLWWG